MKTVVFLLSFSLLITACSPAQKSPQQAKDSVPAQLLHRHYYDHMPEYTFFGLDSSIPPDSITSLTLDLITLANGFPAQVYTFRNLHTLYFEGVSENVRLDERILQLTKLRHVTFKGRLEKVAVSYDSTLALICRLPSLETLELQSLLELPFVFPPGSHLRQMFISGCGKKVTDAFIRMKGLENLKELEMLSILQSCMANLPDGIFEMEKLRYLNLSMNLFPRAEENSMPHTFRIGAIPPTINNLVDLEELILDQAGVKSMSIDPKRLTKLKKIKLSGNCYGQKTHDQLKKDFPDAGIWNYVELPSICE
ncbi:MAG: hypothetical protein M3R17_10195 [Bacteroidota bacterium]|nr:hypothetical protein [Bacteroidota bacterium]